MRRSSPFLVLAVVASFAGAARAHIVLDFPQNRNDQAVREVNKAGPCGGGTDDPRDEGRVSTFAPGATITVRWRETIGHTGRFRIAFAPEGSDQATFNDPANILLDIADPSGSAGNIGDGNKWEAEVTLPDTPCNNCSLQLVQVMNGNTNDPVADPDDFSTYYQCADLVLGGGSPTVDDGSNGSIDTGGDDHGCAATTNGSLLSLAGLLAFVRRFRSRRSS